jgi:hypothetical protein
MVAQGGPMYALYVGSPDGRKQVYRDGQLASWVSLWEHGLAAVGLYAAHQRDAGNADLYQLLRRVCMTLRDFGWFRENGQWYTVHDSAWNNGLAPSLSTTSREVTYLPHAGDVGSWTFTGILVAREVLGTSPELNAYINSVTGGKEADNRRQAEWWAAVRGVV